MAAVNINAIDLNLLLAFHAMLEHRNVTRAGESQNLSQPENWRGLSAQDFVQTDAGSA